MDREEWRPFLKRWSEEWIAGHDPEQDQPLDESVVRDGWLSFAPASADEIAAAEARLGCSLPPSLREFLGVTNGWRDAGPFIYRLAGTAELGWLRDLDPLWIEAYGTAADEGLDAEEGVTPLFERALQVSLDVLPIPEDASGAGIVDTVTGATLLWTGLRQGPVHRVVIERGVEAGRALEDGRLLPHPELMAEMVDVALEPNAAAEPVDGLVLGGGHEPGPRVGRDS